MPARRVRFAARRKIVGHSQEQLAERVGVDRSTIVRWESGETEPQPWLRPKIADALQLSIEELNGVLDGDHPGRPQTPRPGVDLVAVAGQRQQVEMLESVYDQSPSSALLGAAGQCLGQISAMYSHAASDRMRRELCRAEAEAATLMGKLIWDSSQRRDHAAAHAYFDQAIAAAKQLHDPAAEGRAVLRKGMITLYGQQDPRLGLALSVHAWKITNPASQVLAGLSALHAAEAQSMLGERLECERLLGQAETHFGQITRLKDTRRAERTLENTAESPDIGPKSRAIVLGNLTLAYIHQRRIDEAVAVLNQAIDIVAENWGGGGLNIAFHAGRELKPWRAMSTVQDVNDRLLGLMTRE